MIASKMKYMFRCLLATIVAIGVSSCEHKDLCYHHPHTIKLKVQYDWQYAPEADTDGMFIFFYPVEGGEYYQFAFGDTNKESGRSRPVGGEIEVPPGVYNVITYSYLDPSGIQYSGINDYYTHEAYTRVGDLLEPINGNATSSIPRTTGSEEEDVVITPDMLYGVAVTLITVPEHGSTYIHEVIDSSMKGPILKIEAEKDVIFTFAPREMVCSYTYEIINVTNIDQFSKGCVSLSSMSGSMNLSCGELGKDCVTLTTGATADPESNRIYGGFYTFGHHEENAAPHKMMLYAILKDGQKRTFGTDLERFNVTDQIHNAPDKRRVHIIIDGLELPEPVQMENGFVPEVDDWEDGGTTKIPV